MPDRLVIYPRDCRTVMAAWPDACVDAVVSDPPYGLEFMGREWDSFRTGDGFRRSRNQADSGRGNVFGRASRTAPEYIAGHNYQQWCEEWARECLRILKPGGYLAAFGGTRTYHRLACAIEDAGFEIRDSLHWMYGSGFPKSLDVSKAIDKTAGAEREVAGSPPYMRGRAGQSCSETRRVSYDYQPQPLTASATEDATRWEGWGTALKPAHEPIVLARKPLTGTVAANVLEHGTGAVNVDGCRVAHASSADRAESEGKNQHTGYSNASDRLGANGIYGEAGVQRPDYDGSAGRWPPNILLTHSASCESAGTRRVRANGGGGTNGKPGGNKVLGAQSHSRPRSDFSHTDTDGMEIVESWECVPGCPVAKLDGQSGVSKSSGGKGAASQKSALNGDVYAGGYSGATLGQNAGGLGDTGGASRFFPQFAWSPEYDAPFLYQAKAPKKERPQVEGLPGHPTVKPLALMRWLVRLVTPPDGIVCDPFAGTGTTGQACLHEGLRAVLCENDPSSAALIRKRLESYGDWSCR